jgi:hypothetical protein
VADPRWLNVGSGPFNAPAPWWNIDRVRREGNTEPDEVIETDWLPYTEGSVERIYAGHCLEHIPWEQLLDVLHDWRRVLTGGGEIAVVGPDVDRALSWFLAGKLTRSQVWERLEADEGQHDLGGSDDPHARHHWNCTAGRVTSALERAGFVQVRELPIASPELDRWPVVGRAEDQFAVLAMKP